jgi:hypothetical protein
MDTLFPPDYPAAPGLSMPDLNLGNPMSSVASTYSINALPDPVKPPLMEPVLYGDPADIERMGIDGATGTLLYDLNLAGVQGVPEPDELARPIKPQGSNDPTFIAPDFSVPGLKPYDLTGPGIDFFHELSVDPVLPDLTDYEHPRGLDVQGNSLLTPDPQLADLLSYDNPMGLSITRHPLLPDPLLPDLQSPSLEQETHMPADERPGDLDPSALHVMDPATSAQVADKDYPEVFMDQSGMNNTRSRHMTLLMDGLTDEERRR